MTNRFFTFPNSSIRPKVAGVLTALLLNVYPFSSLQVIADEEIWDVPLLMQELSLINTIKLDFIETKKSVFLITDTILKGNMEYRAPDYLEKVTLSPIWERVIIDGDSMTIEKVPGSGKQEDEIIRQTYSVESYPLLKSAVESITAMLAGNIEQLTSRYDVDMTGTRAGWELVLAPRTPEVQKILESISLSGENNQIQNVVTIQSDGDESTIELQYRSLN